MSAVVTKGDFSIYTLTHLVRLLFSATVQAALKWTVRSESMMKSIHEYNKGPLYGNETGVGVQKKNTEKLSTELIAARM